MDDDEAAFTAMVHQHRRVLLVHCYRMTGSFDDAEELVQETFLRAWKSMGGFAGRSTLRTWLYRIATNACLDHLAGRGRRLLPHQLTPPADPLGNLSGSGHEWLQPFPDHLWEPAAPREAEPDAAVVARETIELAFLAAIQHLPPRQRAVLITRDVLGWPARQTAELLDTSVASVNSALQRARTTLKDHLPPRRADWATPEEPTAEQQAVLRRYMRAVEDADLTAVAGLLAEDVRATMPPYPQWFRGRTDLLAALAGGWDPGSPDFVGEFRLLPTGANRQPAAAGYLRRPGDDVFRPFGIGVLDIEGGLIRELTTFHAPNLFPAFGLPPTLPAHHSGAGTSPT
ncbi:sigma-70 family RNA polymerase sigma factor [Micromonosporaceae bacterium Da 78-11]